MLTGYGLLLQTSEQIGGIALSWIKEWDNNPKGEKPNLLEIHALLVKVQNIFPDLFITSNRAEQFNSVHDREISYHGHRNLNQANRHLDAWVLFKYYSKGVKNFLLKTKLSFPISIVQNALHLTFDQTIIK